LDCFVFLRYNFFMQISFEFILVGVSLLFLTSVIASKVSDRFGIPILLLFLAIGILAGSEGIGGIYFDDPYLTQYVSITALIIILFSGGLDTRWKSIRPVFKEGMTLATLGVLLTAVGFGLIAYFVLRLPILESFLIGAITSSTDAAAVFAILRSRGVNLKPRLAPLLELESGSNDPMAVILTVTLIGFITGLSSSVIGAVGLVLLQLGIGALIGWLMSRAALYLINRIKLGYEGLYDILLIALALLAYGGTTLIKGSGFLAVYIFAVLLGKSDFLHKRSVLRFFDSAAWVSQIVLFLTLGLLVFPSRLVPVMLPGLSLALGLILVARPLAVFISLIPFKYTFKEKVFLSWVGLRGAVPIVLATYPLVAGLTNADLIFNIVFFVVVVSVLLQGTLLPFFARKLGIECDEPPPRKYPIEIVSGDLIQSQLKEVRIPAGSFADGKAIYELKLPPGFLVILISRAESYIQPNGSTVLLAGDAVLALTEDDALTEAKQILTMPSSPNVKI
jgi:cell volume regulation protein A